MCKLRFEGENAIVEPIYLKSELYLLLVDLKGDKDTCLILESLQGGFRSSLKALEDGREVDAKTDIVQALGIDNTSAVERSILALETGEIWKLGHEMRAAQDRFDRCLTPYCTQQLSAPRLRSLLALFEENAIKVSFRSNNCKYGSQINHA